EILLVKLQPGRWTDPIVCELTNAQLDFAKYQALSYVWGSPRATRSIRLDGPTYPVTSNLESELRHQRERFGDELVLWVDALCINQEDVEERTQQVQLMGLMYDKCTEGIVYLGD
ncbi:HET-domain-containing protein, partial [Clathrospora elynae]